MWRIASEYCSGTKTESNARNGNCSRNSEKRVEKAIEGAKPVAAENLRCHDPHNLKNGTMNEEVRNELPQLKSVEDTIADELRQYWLDPSKDYPEPHFLYEYNGVGFSPLGGIQAISGQKKNGKTFVLAQLMAAALGADSARVADYLGKLQVRRSTIEHLGHQPKVLYCDTEMEQLNTAKVLRRVHWLCNWDMKVRNERFFVLWLREVPKSDTQTANKERWRLIKNAIGQTEPDIVFIDGLRDLVNDFNNNEESAAIVTEMMSLASQRNICIWNVLHMNPRPSNDDESKMRGHLGTELGNKVSDTFVSTKKKDAATGRVTFSVKQQDARGKDIEDWQFEVTDDAGSLGIPRILGSISVADSEAQQIDKFLAAFNWTRSGATLSAIRNYAYSKGVTSNRRVEKVIEAATELGIIYRGEGKKYYYVGLTKNVPQDTSTDLPFGDAPTDEPF